MNWRDLAVRFHGQSVDRQSVRRRTRRRRISFETLESKQLLAVVMSELMADNATTLADEDGDYSDWIELYNNGPGAVHLNGWHLTDTAGNPTKWTLPAVTLPADDRLVIFASNKNRTVVGQNLHTNFRLSAAGEYVGLIRPDGLTVEHAIAGYPTVAADVSYGLANDSNTLGFFATPTPGVANSRQLADDGGAVVISELMYSLPRDSILATEDINLEFIELYNRGSTAIDVTNWQITRGVSFTFPAATIQGGQRLVVAANRDAFAARYPNVSNVVGGWQGKLSNSGETIEVIDAFGREVDRLSYADEGDWAVRTVETFTQRYSGWTWESSHDGGGHSLELINADQTNDHGQNWAASSAAGGTPGQPNSVANANVAPLISNVAHFPPVPTAADTVVVHAVVRDESAIAQVEVNWRADASLPFSTLVMTDDGVAGDEVASDGVYAATLPAQADRTVIEFYVRAVDTSQQVRTWPAATSTGQQDANALYQVIDEFDPASLQPGDPATYFTIMTPTDRETFRGMTRQLDAQFNATFVSYTGGNGFDVRYNTGVRYRGSGSRDDTVPNNRINFPHDQAWQGVTAINLNQNNVLDQVVGSALFRAANVPAADVLPVRLMTNGVNLQGGNGIYAHSEVLDSDYANNHFPNDSGGNLYRGRRPDESPPGGAGAGLAYFGTDPAPYVSYLKSTNGSEADWSDVIELTSVLNLTSDDQFVAEVRRVIDVDQWFRTLAMNSIISNGEFGLFTGDGLGDDYAMYRGVEDGRFQLVPYDWDSLFGNANESLFRATGVPALSRLILHPAFLPDFYRAYQQLVDGFVRTDFAEIVIDQALTGIAGANRIANIKSFLQDRANNIEAQTQQPLAAESTSELLGDVYRSTYDGFFALGTYPTAGTHAVRVDGELAVLDGTNWSFSSDGPVVGDALLPLGATWRYLDDGSDQGTAWRDPAFDDSSWATGPGQLGYGDGDESTEIGFGGNESQRFATSYFRTEFDVQNLEEIVGLAIEMIYDDGAAAYLNGVEILRVDLAADATFDQFASVLRGREAEVRLESFSLPASALAALQRGTNVLAVEVHQGSGDSPDLSLDLRLSTVKTSEPTTRLQVGMNRIPVASYDNAAGTGTPTAETTLDIWFDNNQETIVTADITSNTTWSIADSPIRVSGDVTVAANATLRVDPGVTVFFDDDASLIVRGQLDAVGTATQKIWFTRTPGQTAWSGLQFRASQNDNRITHAIMEYGVTGDGMIGIENSNITIENSLFDHTDRRRIRSIDSSLVVRDSVFANIFEPDERPTTDNQSEHVWGRGIPEGGQWLLQGNDFGTITGHNDGVDFDSVKGVGRYAQIINNRFRGGGDDALDMTGDVYIEGNLFTNYVKDRFNVDPGESNTISASDGDFWAVRNIFDNVQHASLIKEGAFMHFLNNSVISSEFAPLYFDLPGQTSGPGRGADVSGSLFANTTATFSQIQPDTQLSVSFSFLPAADADSIGGLFNQFGDPHVGGADNDYQLLAGSLARGFGPGGADIGARIAAGATLAGVPSGVTNSQSARIVVGGPGYAEFRYQLDTGPISAATPIGTLIRLDNLSLGSHQLSVWGRNALGQWQIEPTVSQSWTVVPSLSATIRLNEIEVNDGATPDRIELFNTGATAVDLSGYSLSDDASNPRKFVFPAGTSLGVGGFLVVDASVTGNAGGNGAPLNAGFGLNRDGDELHLFTPAGTLLDSVVFGLQAHSMSLGRTTDNSAPADSWTLTVPSLGAPNRATPLGDLRSIRINEWYATGGLRLEEDHLELLNLSDLPVAIGGLMITDEPFAIPNQTQIAPLSFLAGNGALDLIADGRSALGPIHLGFKLSATHEHLALISEEGTLVDQVFYYPQTDNYSQGRLASELDEGRYPFYDLPTFGTANVPRSSGVTTVIQTNFDGTWKYDASGADLGVDWRTLNFDDSAWAEGPGLLGNENEALPETLRTEFPIGPLTFYFRQTVNLAADVDLGQLEASFSTIVDDGFIVYVNGEEIVRQGMPDGPVDATTLANRNVNEAQLEGPFTVPNQAWRTGTNVIAVEVHQTRANSSDLVFGLAMTGTVPVVDNSTSLREQLFRSLRITEIMYDAGDSDAEYIEVQNISDANLNVAGVRLSGGIDFVFPAGFNLAAGAATIVVNDTDLVRQRFGIGPRIAGEYAGRLNNGGEVIALQMPAPLETAMLRFEYEPTWYATASGGGESLTIVDPTVADRLWSDRSSWQSAAPTPGRGQNVDLPADLNADGVVTAADIDLLCAAIRAGDALADLNQDQRVNDADLESYLNDFLNTSYGDANLDGVFNSSDLVAIFVVGEYEDAIAGNSTWADGDWNCDGDFTTRDLVFAFAFGFYQNT